MPRDVAALLERAVRCVSREMGGVPNIAGCIRWMTLHFAETHASPEHEARWRSHPILERDGWICPMPHCLAAVARHLRNSIKRDAWRDERLVARAGRATPAWTAKRM